MTTVLLVEDDPAIAQPLSRALQREGYRVLPVQTGVGAVSAFTVHGADITLVILDLGLPDLDGLEVCRRIRASGKDVPVLMLTARTDEADFVVGLDAGADDYVAKPFRMAELLARARALQRRRIPALMDIGGVRVETGSRRVEVDGVEIALSNKEFELLRVMMSRAGQVVTREEILSEVWNDPSMKTSKTLDMHMSWLRRKLAGQDSGTAAVGRAADLHRPRRRFPLRNGLSACGRRDEKTRADLDPAGDRGNGADPRGAAVHRVLAGGRRPDAHATCPAGWSPSPPPSPTSPAPRRSTSVSSRRRCRPAAGWTSGWPGRIDQSIGTATTDQVYSEQLAMAGGGTLRLAVPESYLRAEQWKALALVGARGAAVGGGRHRGGAADRRPAGHPDDRRGQAGRPARFRRLPHLPAAVRHPRAGPGGRRARLVGAGHRGPDRPGARPGRRHLPSAAHPADRAAAAAGGTRRPPGSAGRRGGQEALEQTDRLVTVVDDLLANARSERAAGASEVVLGDELAEIEAEWGPRLAEAGRSLTVRCPRDTSCTPRPGRLREAIGVLVENSLRHGAGRSASPCGPRPGARGRWWCWRSATRVPASRRTGRARLRPGGLDGVIHRHRARPGPGVHRGRRRPAGAAHGPCRRSSRSSWRWVSAGGGGDRAAGGAEAAATERGDRGIGGLT